MPLVNYLHACAKGKAIVLYVCQHENRHFGKSRHLSNLLASLCSQSLQKMHLVRFKLFGIAHEHHEQHLLLRHCCHIILFKAQIFVHTIVRIKFFSNPSWK